ncbi:MAG: NADH-quinone oxidoreductase subunit K, partial [Sphingobacterium sp.]
YLILRRSMVKLLLGIMLLGHGTNILIFVVGKITKGHPPVIDETYKVFQEIYADPIPQALILTAIVISFGLTSFAIVLLKRVYALVDSDDLDNLNTPEEEDI